MTVDLASWTYLSGMLAVAETRLLTNDEFLDLLRQPTLEAVRQRCRQVETYVHQPDTPGESCGRALEREYVHIACDLARQSPDAAVAKLMLANYIFAEVRAILRREMLADASAEPPGYLTAGHIEALSGGTIDGRIDFEAMAADIRSRVEKTGDPTGMIDLMLDREELLWILELGRSVGSRFIADWVTEMVTLQAALTICRAQLAGESESRLIGDFLAPPLDDEWLVTLVREDFDRMDNVLMERFTKQEGLIITVARRTIGHIAREVDDKLTHRVREARYVAFGPERLLGYLWALGIENLNLRLITQTFIVEADRDETRTLLRDSYMG